MNKDKAWERRLTNAKLAGAELSHTRQNNLDAMRRLAEGDSFVNFGITRVIETVREEGWDQARALEAAAHITECSDDVDYAEGRGYISPRATLKGLRAAAAKIHEVASAHGSILLATGHPGGLLTFYIELASLIRRLGGRVVDGASGQPLPTPNWFVDSVLGVGVVTDTGGVLHSHDVIPGELLLDGLPEPPDLVFADHGFAGAAINRGIPTIAIMDTNDPGLAVAHTLGCDVIVIPMNDNRPSHVSHEAFLILEELLPTSSPAAQVTEPVLVPAGRG